MFDDIQDDNEHDIDVTIAQGRGEEDEADKDEDEDDTDEPMTDRDDNRPRRHLTRYERHARMADAGCDTWEEYRDER